MGEQQDWAAAVRRVREDGTREYGPLELCDEVLDRRLRRVVAKAGDEAAKDDPGDDATRLSRLHGGDLFLSIACDERVEGAWRALQDRLFPGLRGLLRGRGVPAAEAEEIVRELPGELIRPTAGDGTVTALSSYLGRGSLQAWLCRVALNRFRDRSRAAARGPRMRPAVDDDLRGDETGAPPDHVVGEETKQRMKRAVRQALLDLSAREWLIIARIHVQGETLTTVATRLGVSVPRVHQLEKRARTRLVESVRRQLADDSVSQWIGRGWLKPWLVAGLAELMDDLRREGHGGFTSADASD